MKGFSSSRDMPQERFPLQAVSAFRQLEEEAAAHDLVLVLAASKPGQSAACLVYYENNVPFLYRGKVSTVAELNETDALNGYTKR